MREQLAGRRNDSQGRLTALANALGDSEGRVRDKACVYVIGSYGRGEASPHSDLDLFIVSKTVGDKPALSRLDEICVKADLIAAARARGIPDFSGDGEYLQAYRTKDLIESLGHPDDDASNTFTARLLLLLESRPLLGADVYRYVIDEVIGSYWRDYQDHKSDFCPQFLANDILRLWRTFCVNYEARTYREPAEKLAKRRLKNYKLKHSRLLTCYSGLAHLLAVHAIHHSVSPEQAREMAFLSPTQRMEWIAAQRELATCSQAASAVLDRYNDFLQATNEVESRLVDVFMDPERRKAFTSKEHELGDRIFDLLRALGDRSSFYRVLVV